jgi:signal transduction histidine kinase
VSLSFEQKNRPQLTIADDGRGPADSSPNHGFGLTGMHERIGLLGGNVKSGMRTEGGFELKVEVPA